MRTNLLFTLLAALQCALAAGQCSVAVAPPPGCNMVTSDGVINDDEGGCYRICAGLTVEVVYSAGCLFLLEEDVNLTITDSEGDEIYAKPGCTITNASDADLGWAGNPANVAVNNSGGGTLILTFLCDPVVYDYILVGGPGACASSTNIEQYRVESELLLFPNPMCTGQESITIGGTAEIQNLSLFDASGKRISINFEPSERKVRVHGGLPVGLYICQLTTSEHIQTYKLTVY